MLLDTYQISKASIGRALSQHYGCPFVAYDERAAVDAGLLRGLNVAYLRMNYWMPLRRNGDHHAIQSRARVTEIAALARQQGMTTLLQDGVLKVLGGLTDLTQVKAVADR